MSVQLKAGGRFRSTTCATEVVIVKGAGEIDLCCGGASMVPVGETDSAGAPAAPFNEGTLVGKRYASEEDAIELLCTKAGAGTLSIGHASFQE